MDTPDLFARHGKHAEGVIVAQVLLHREGKFRQIGQGFQIVGMHAGFVELLFVEGHIVIGMFQRPFHPVQLQGRDFIARGDFNRVEVFFTGGQVFHWGSSKWVPLMMRDPPRNCAITVPSSRVTLTSYIPERPATLISCAVAVRVSPSVPGTR